MNFDKRYIQHCINDLKKVKSFLEFMSYNGFKFEKIDCIIDLLKELKKEVKE